jgi:hypothetical protein
MNFMNMRIKSKPVFAALLAALLALAVGGVASAAALLDDGAPDVKANDVTPVAIAPLVAVPAEQARLFDVLRQPAATAVPAEVRAQFANGGPGVSAVGADIAQARSVTVGGRSFYIVPGSKGICLVLPDGGNACTDDLGKVARTGLALAVVPPAPGPVKDMNDPVGPGTVVTYGLVPDGITGVAATAESGGSVKAEINGNAYVIKSDSPLVSGSFDRSATK